MKQLRLWAAAAILASGFSANAALADCGDVTITQMDWASSIIVTEVSVFLMEQGYGCAVTRVPSSTNPAMTSVAETGEPDIVTEIWVNNAPALEKLIDAGKVEPLTQVLSDGAVEGWFVPKYLVDAHPELATLDGLLAAPELVGARFHDCPEGWGCKTINANLAQAVGLENRGFEVFVHGSSETLGTSIAAAYASEEPWFGYYWAPTALLGKYPMVKVDMGAFDDAVHDCNKLEDCARPQLSAYPSAEVLTVVTTDFAAREPEVVELMKNVSFTNAQMGEVLAWQEDNSASGQEAAVYFLQNYKDVWSDWLDDEARGKLAAIVE